MVLGYIWQFIFKSVVPAIGSAIGIQKLADILILSNPNLTLFGLVFAFTWQYAGYIMMIYVAALLNVPQELVEAASIDGANYWQKLKNVTLPMIAHAFTITTFLTLVNSFKQYDIIVALTNGGPTAMFKGDVVNSTELLAVHIYNVAFKYNRMAEGQARAIVFFIMLSVISIAQVYYNKKARLKCNDFKKKLKEVLLQLLTLILFLITIFPFFIVIINSSKSSLEIVTNPIKLPDRWVQLFINIKTIWTNPNLRYASSVYASVIITTFSLLTIALFSAMAAWVLVRRKTKLSNFIFLLFVSGLIIPFQVVMFPLVSFFRMINEAIGLPMLRTYHGMIFAYIGFGAPLAVFMFHGFIKTIPLELEEAAWIDGCSKPQIFFKIILPILKPIIVTICILNAIWIWNDFLLPSLVLGVGQNIQTIPLAIAAFAGSFVKNGI
ncbi:ABC transporter permease subunit [Caloramator sp. mosi_1]|uniref:ABC transporter permease n=1 Tax=Caloramator sp. mosi_1 TaxID=3023090 RepID=UPI0023600E2A|nr:ABC transporter permease subunit [Caloramator sp. mosi_1]WDC84821.1 ABC transporter permease subunit [Caloramator sp. mosi_1]